MKLYRKILLSITVSLFSISSLFTFLYASWSTGGDPVNDNANSANQTYTNTAVDAICFNETTNVVYSSLTKAMAVNCITYGIFHSGG